MSALIQLAQMKIQLALVQKQLAFWTQLAYNFRHWLFDSYLQGAHAYTTDAMHMLLDHKLLGYVGEGK